MTGIVRPMGAVDALETMGAWLLGFVWALPLLYAVWTAFHPGQYAAHFDLTAPLTLVNFEKAWEAAPFARYFLNSFLLVTSVLAGQIVLSTLAAYAFARFAFFGRELMFALVLVQLMIMPDVLIVENYRTMRWLGLHLACVCAARPANLHRLRAGQRQLPLEQLSLAAGDHQFDYHAAGDGGAVRVRLDRSGDRLVDHHGGDSADQRAVAGGVPAVPAAIRAELHAGGDQVNGAQIGPRFISTSRN